MQETAEAERLCERDSGTGVDDTEEEEAQPELELEPEVSREHRDVDSHS